MWQAFLRVDYTTTLIHRRGNVCDGAVGTAVAGLIPPFTHSHNLRTLLSWLSRASRVSRRKRCQRIEENSDLLGVDFLICGDGDDE